MDVAKDVVDARRFRRHLRSVISAVVGNHLCGLLLFGSRARGDARPDSDWDVAVLADENANVAALRADLGRATASFDPELEGQYVQIVILRPSDMQASGTLVLNLEAEAVEL